tara:strand:- start:25749 stop:28346 length:2598 start_codon:yes stop_codon:yes gene_type:complete
MSNYMRNRKTLSSVADAYREMYATPNEDILNEELIDSLIEDVRDEEINDWLDYLEEDGMMSVPMKNKKKIQQALISKYAKKHPKVKITFGTQSKGKFVDDNNVNFKGNDKDIDNLMKDIQKDKPLMKMMEDNDLDESKGLAAKAKKSGISVGTLRKVYNRGMAAWKTGHRPGTTPQQWGMARVNAFIVKKKKGNLNHDKDLAHVIHPDDNMLEALTTMPDSVKDRISNLRNKKMDVKYDSDEYHRIQKQIDSLMRQYRKESLDEVKRQEVEAMKKVSKDMQSVLKAYQKIANMGDKELKNTVHNKDYKKVLDARDTILKMIGTLNTKLAMQKEDFELVEASAGEMIDKLFKTGGDKMFQYGVAKLLNMTGVKVAMAMQKQNPQGFKNTMVAMGKDNKIKLATNNALMKMFKQQGVKPLPEELDNDDKPVVKKIVTMLKKASKKHAKQADDLEKAVSEELEEAMKTSLPMPRLKKSGKFSINLVFPAPNTMYSIRFRNESFMIAPDEVKDLIKILSQRDIVTKNPKGMEKIREEVSEGKGKNFAQQAAIAIAKKKSGKYDKDGKKIDERVKDGKLDPLSKMGKSKLTGQEINKYYRDNPKQKAAARDKTVKKAIELALDLSGATNYAIKEIEKLKRGLSKNPAVKLALRHANESKEFTGHHVVIENLSPANVVKLKTFGKMMAKMTKLPFDEKDPEKSIDKLMGQIWKQKHPPANWERLHKMVAMLRDIGVKMPSLKGKYMGLDPVTKKAIFYKEGTDEMVEWHQKIEDIKEGIEELVEKKEMSAADINKIKKMTDRNDHTGSLMHLAKLLGDKKGLDALKGIMMTHKALGHMPDGLMRTRGQIYDNLMRQSSSKYSNHKDVISSF